MSKYLYADGKPVQPEPGDHGMDVVIPPGEAWLTRAIDDAEEPGGMCVMEDQPEEMVCSLQASRKHAESNAFNRLNQPATVEFIWFGKSHLYPLEDYPEVAALWRDRLLSEARILARSIQGDQAIAYEFIDGDGSFAAWVTHGIEGAISFFKEKPLPRAENFDPLLRRVWATADRIKNSSAADYQVLHDAGLEFMHTRHEQAIVNKRLKDRLEGLIHTAEVEQKVAEETEGAAFWLLDLYGQAVCKDPASLVAYRFGVLTMRASARGAGYLLAESSTRVALHEAAAIVRRDLPKAATGLLLGWLKKGFTDPKNLTPIETFAEQLISIQIYIFFFAIDYALFESPQAGQHADEDFLQKLAPGLAGEIVNAIAAIMVSSLTSKAPMTPEQRKQVERLGAVIPAVIGSCIGEFAKMKAMADAEKRPFYEVFCAEGGWALVRVIRDGGKAFLQQPVQSAMDETHERERKMWEGLILSLWLKTATVDSSRLRAAREASEPKTELGWKQPVKQTPSANQMSPSKPATSKPGPTESGEIGIGKLKPAAGEANPPNLTKPPKPSRAQRKSVQRAPRRNRRPSSREFTPSQKEAYYILNSMEVRRRFPEFRNDPTPHYICVLCGFLSLNRSFFRVDHVFEVQHGGTRDSWTPEEMRQTYEQLKVAKTYEKGLNGDIICEGCNQAKKTTGFPKEGAGYAYTKPDDDKNPVHEAQGGPDGKRYQNR